MSNARNLANLLNTDTTIATGDVADGSITTAKIADSAVTNAKFQNAPTFTGTLTAGNIESGDIRIEDTSPTLLYNDTNESTDNKAFQLTGSGGVFQIQYLNDSLGGGGGYISFPRTGNNLDSFDMFRAGNLKNRLTTTGDNYITSGNFGVGTTDPQQKMHVSYDTSNTNLGNNAGADITTGMRIHNENSTNGSYASIDLRASSGDVRLTSVYKGSGNTSDFVVLNDGGSSTLQEVLRIDQNGHITKPLQSAFSVKLTSEANNKTGNATGFLLGSLGSTEIFDRNNDINNFLFVAPVTGLYLISVLIMYDGFGSANSGFAQISTSNRTYQIDLFNPAGNSNVGVNHTVKGTFLCDMDANDTCQPLLYINGAGGTVVDIQATNTMMSGILLA